MATRFSISSPRRRSLLEEAVESVVRMDSVSETSTDPRFWRRVAAIVNPTSSARLLEATSRSDQAARRYSHLESHPDASRLTEKNPHNIHGGLLEEDCPSSSIDELLGGLVIQPGTGAKGAFLALWDMFMTVLLAWCAVADPLNIAFAMHGGIPAMVQFSDNAITVSFTLDMAMQVIVAKQHAQESLQRELVEKNVRKLAAMYCAAPCVDRERGWFWLDLIIVLPGWYSLCYNEAVGLSGLILLRLLRMLHAPRFRRLSRLANAAHARYGFPMFMVECVKCVAITLLVCHWMASVWVIMESRVRSSRFHLHSPDDVPMSWLSALSGAKGDACMPSAEEDFGCVYLLAYYWAVTTLTTVGYGDITPQNKEEYGVAVVSMLLVGYTWAFIVGTVVSILSNLDPAEEEYKRSLDDLGELAKRRGLPNELQVRLRSFMHETRHFAQMNRQRALVQRCLSAGLQREIADLSAEVRGVVAQVDWTRHLSHDVVLDIVRHLVPEAYGPDEIIQMFGSMILIQRGVAAVGSRIISRGDVYGQYDILMETRSLIDTRCPWTMSFVELLKLSKKDLVLVARLHPEADRRLRRVQIRTAVFRAFVKHAGRIKRLRALGKLPATDQDSRRHVEDEGTHLKRCFSSPHSAVVSETSPAHQVGFDDGLTRLTRLVEQLVVKQEACHHEVMAEVAELKQAVYGGVSRTPRRGLTHSIDQAVGTARRMLGRRERRGLHCGSSSADELEEVDAQDATGTQSMPRQSTPLSQPTSPPSPRLLSPTRAHSLTSQATGAQPVVSAANNDVGHRPSFGLSLLRASYRAPTFSSETRGS